MYREHSPAPPLAPFVACYWTRGPTSGPRSERARRILPDGCLDIIFEGQPRDGLAGSVVGAMTKPLLLPDEPDPAHYIAVRFRPGMALPFLGVAARELTDESASVADLSLPGERELSARLSEASNVPEQIAVLEAYLLQRLHRLSTVFPQVDPIVAAVVRRVEAGLGDLSIDALSTFAGITRQHLARRFGQHVGLTPKAFVRIMRFRRVLSALEAGGPVDWAGLAAELGYYDQSHLIADFREFTGLSPHRFQISKIGGDALT